MNMARFIFFLIGVGGLVLIGYHTNWLVSLGVYMTHFCVANNDQ